MNARIIAAMLLIPWVSALADPPATSCAATGATGAHCSAECSGTQQAVCYASGTEAHCECQDERGPRRWGPVTTNGTAEISGLQTFRDYLTGTLATPGALQLANDVTATISAIQTHGQSAYEQANNDYADHWDALPAADRSAMLGWIGEHTTLH